MGLLIMWKSGTLSNYFSFVGKGFIGVFVVWKETIIYLGNVYSSCNFNLKRLSWKELLACKAKFNVGKWCIGGDFIAIKKVNERKMNSLVIYRGDDKIYGVYH